MDIQTVRAQFPQYNDLSDKQLADAIHAKYYADLPKEQVYARIGLTKPEGGFIAAAKAGATELSGGISALAGKLGLKEEAQAEAEYKAAKEKAAGIFKPTEEGWTEAPFTKFKELLGGSLPYMAAPLAAGAAAAALPVTGTAAALTTLGAAGLTSAGQFTATNLARQMEEGKKLAETDLGAAALAAVPQAALDTLSMRMIPGIGRMFGQAGVKITAENAKQIAEQGLKKTLIDYTAKTGKTAGIEGATEAAQQVFERLQAGLNITDEKARAEYFDSFLGGAILGGTLAPAGRFVERGREQREARGLLEGQAAEQRKAAREAEEAKKKDPQYLLDLDKRYTDAVAQMRQMQEGLKAKPGKDAAPDARMEYQQRVEALKSFVNDTMRPLTAEYTPRKAEIAQAKERLRVEGMSPEDYADYAYEQRVKASQAALQAQRKPAAEEAERLSADFADIAAPLTEKIAPEIQYAQDRVRLAQSQAQGGLEPAELAEYLMQDPAMAQRLVETKTAIPGVSKRESDAILGGLKLQLQDRVKQERAATQAELQQRQADLTAQQVPKETDPLAMWKASVEQTEEQATDELLRPNFETLRPTGPATVAVAPGITPIQNPTTLLKRLDDLIITRDKAAAEADSAFTSGNKELGVKKSQEREAAQTALNNLEQMEGAPRALMSLRKAQDTALMNAAQLIDDLKVGRTLGGPEAATASSTPQTLINQINKQRDAFITAAVQEAAATRKLYAKALPQEEATKAANQIREVFNEWVTRSMAQPRSAVEQERVVAPAQMRGTEVVRGAETERFDPRPLEERRFGAYKAATQVLQEQLRQISSRLSEVPKEGRRVEPTLKMQFPETEAAKVAEAKGETAQTLEGQLRRRRDYAQGLIDQAFQTRKVPGIAETLLTRAQDFLPTAPNTLLDAVENVADRIIRGQPLERSDLIALRDEVRAASARPGEAEVAGERVGQRELFPAEERRALAPKEERGALGLIREKPEAFRAVQAKESAKAQRVAAATQRSEQLTQDIRTELDRIDKERQAALEQRVEDRRGSLQSAWQSAVKKAKNLVLSARKTAQKPQIDALKKEIDAIRKGGIEGLNKETIDRLLAARAELDKLSGEFDTVVEAAEFLPIAQANKWVAYERGALDQAEKALAETRTPQTVSAVQQQKAALQRAEQARVQSLKGEEKAAEAARMRAAQTGLGLPGQRRVEGRVERIEPEQTAAQRAAEAEETRTQAREESAQRAAERDAERTELEQRVLDLGSQVAEREAAQKRARTPESKAKIQTEIDALTKDVTLAQGQLDALGEAKPRKKGPATVPTGAALAKQKPLRTGYRKALEAASEGMRRERERDVEIPGVFEFGPQEKLFSRGATPSPSTTASVRTELKKAFPDLGRVQIFDTVDALIAANPQYEGKIPSDARGFVDTAGNKAFLIAENINQGQALSVLLHEVGAHIGLKNVLGAAQYNTLVNAVKFWEKKADGSVESRVAQAARARVEAAETTAGQVNDELLAYAIEEAVNAGVKPTETKGVIGRWLSQIAALFRKGLEKFGLPPKALDAQGIVDMAFGAAKMEMRPAVAQVSRRQFLRGAGAALGAMKLPPLSKEMNLRALRSVFEASLDARRAWFDAIKYAVKGKGLGRVIDQYEDVYEGDNALINFTQSDALQDFLYNTTYNENYQGDGYDYYLNELLSGKDGVKVIADLQQALRAQGASLVDAAQKTAKEKGLPEVGELFFSGTEKPSAFKRWFGDSKVVDAQGKPLVVYHGTDKDFTTFDAEKPKTSGAMHGKGFYFADAATASSYSDAPSGGGLVMPVYLKMERPFIGKLTAKDIALLRKEMPEFDAAYKEFVAEEGADGYTPSIERLGVLSGNRNEFIQKALRTAGYDGRIVTDEPSAPWTDPDTEYVVFEPTQIKSATGNRGTYDPTSPNILFSRNLPTAARVADNLIAKEKGVIQNLKDNFLGMGFRAQFVDKLAPLEEALKKGGIDQKKALQAMYYLRMYDQRMHFTSQAISDGVPEIVEKARKDGGTERLIETKPGANISQVVDILKNKDVVKAAGSADAANRLFTLYLAAIRAERVGMDALNFGGKVTEADLKAARAEIEANSTLKNAFDEARDIYNQYNRNLIEFAVQTGALAKSEAKALLASNDYIPYYRMRDGVAQLIVGKETPIRIGNLKDSPHLKELVGGDEAIFDFLTSSVQNTAMLLDMSMKNLATKNAMFELKDVGLATVSKVPKSGKTPDGAVTFKRDGEDYYAVVDTDTLGIDSDLLVKGLAGIPTMFPSFVRVLGIPARFLRRAVVASPVYMARQLFRDSLAATMTSGADITPVLGALKQIGQPKALGARGITGGQVFTGMPEDVTRMLKDMQAGKVSVTSGLAWLEAKSAQADALTREAQYQSYLKQGLSEMEATYMALESMNFSKRGLSPTLHMVSTLIPFFNAQIQGLDVLYKAFAGQMPMNERLAIREKLWTRGMLLAGMSVAYAMAMQDDETYKNAKPEEKYGNWFVQVPGFDQMVRLPIPFELGYVFKALPEAIVNTLANEKGGEEALKAGKHIVQQMIPGASSYFLPQAIKPALETILGTSFYTGRGIESSQEQMREPGFRYRDNTTELAREVGELTGFSPIKMEYLIRGYTGGMGMALLQALSAPFGSSGPEAATKRMSDMPVIGTLFQPNDASGIIDATYERMKQVNQVKETYEDLLNKGRTADAQKYISTRMDAMALASIAGSFREYMGQITEFERGVRASNMTPDQKREKLDQARQMKIKLAESVRAVADRKTPQASPA